MIGTTLKKLLDEREIKVNEFARQIHVPAQTLYSIIRRDNMKIDFELLLRICDALHVPLETFCGTGSTDQPTPEEWETLWKLRRLDAHGRLVTLQLLDAECARMQASEQQPEQQRARERRQEPGPLRRASGTHMRRPLCRWRRRWPGTGPRRRLRRTWQAGCRLRWIRIRTPPCRSRR